MPASALYLSDMGGFPRAGEPVLLHPSGSLYVGTTHEEVTRVNNPVGFFFRTNSLLNNGGVGIVVDNAEITGNNAYSGFFARCVGTDIGYVHATNPTYSQGAIIFVANAYYIYGSGSASGGTYFGSAHSSAPVVFFSGGSGTANERMRILSGGRIAISGGATPLTAPTAYLHIAAGTATANTAPLKFTSGSLNSTAEAGAVEFLTDKFYATITTSNARKELTLNDAALTSGRVPFVTTNGRLTDNTNFTYAVGSLVHINTANASSITHTRSADNTTAYAGYELQNGSTFAGVLSATGPAWTASGIFLAGQMNIDCFSTNGFQIVTRTGPIRFVTGGATTADEQAQIDAAGNIRLCGVGALATNATDGFVYLPSSAGAPSGTPTSVTGGVPVEIDTTNSKFMAYIGGAWKGVTLT